MKRSTRRGGSQNPPIADNPAHARLVEILTSLRPREVENVFTRITGEDHVASKLMREILYWFMPATQNPTHPRATIYRKDCRYWFCRSRDEWWESNRLTRRMLEASYRRCAAFMDVGHFMFKSERRTHYALRFEKLCELLESDPVVRQKLEDSGSSSPSVISQPEGPEPCGSVGTDLALPDSVHSFRNGVQTYQNTGCAGPAAPVVVVPSATGAAAPEPPLPARVVQVGQEVEELENPPEFGNQQVHVLLKASESKPLNQKLEAVRSLSPLAKKFVCYLMIWQQAFEEDHPGRKHHFNDGHVRASRKLAEQGINPKRFQEVLWEAWEARGTSEGHDPLFMCRNHSRKFGLFCKHFTRMEDELMQSGML